MRYPVFFLMGSLIFSGCAVSTHEGVKTTREYRYKQVLVLPFTQGDEAQRNLATHTFREELKTFSEITLIEEKLIDPRIIEELGITHPDSYGTLDFAESPEANHRRQQLAQEFSVQAIVFGSFFIEGQHIYLYIQMMDVQTGIVILSFSKEAQIADNTADATIVNLAKECAQRVIAHIKDNVSITSFYQN